MKILIKNHKKPKNIKFFILKFNKKNSWPFHLKFLGTPLYYQLQNLKFKRQFIANLRKI